MMIIDSYDDKEISCEGMKVFHDANMVHATFCFLQLKVQGEKLHEQ